MIKKIYFLYLILVTHLTLISMERHTTNYNNDLLLKGCLTSNNIDYASELIVTKKCNVNAQWGLDITPLSFVIRQRKPDMVKLLLDNGASLDNNYHTPYLADICEPKGEQLNKPYDQRLIINLLIEKGANIGEAIASYKSDHWIVTFFSENFHHSEKDALLNLNDIDNNGNTALHRAIMLCQINKATALIKAGANTDIKNKNGETFCDITRKKAPQLTPDKVRCIQLSAFKEEKRNIWHTIDQRQRHGKKMIQKQTLALQPPVVKR